VAAVIGCGVSLLTAGALHAWFALSASVYWAFVPLAETLALAAVVWGRRRQRSWPTAIDTYFAGHGPWTLYLILLTGTLASVPPEVGWRLLTTACIAGLFIALAWSACIDFWFFRYMFGASRGRAVCDVALVRVLTWTVVCTVFAIPELSPGPLMDQIDEVFAELSRR
jgi:hypothetical protein